MGMGGAMRLLRVGGASLLLGLLVLAAGLVPRPALAADVVVDGVAYTCDRDGLAQAVVATSPGGTITFDCDDPLINFYSGDLITIPAGSNLTIDGSNGGRDQIVIDGNDETNFLQIADGAELTVRQLTFQHGNMTGNPGGGAIINFGTLTVDQSAFVSNNVTHATGGGAIFSLGTLTVDRSTFTSNTTRDEFWGGGAIYSEGPLSVDRSTFTSNSASSIGGAFASYFFETVTVSRSTFISNSAEWGGAIHHFPDAMKVSQSTFIGNVASESGGAIDSFGLGVSGSDLALTVSQSSFINNAARDGGAIHAEVGMVEIAASTFSGNTATDEGSTINVNHIASVTLRWSTIVQPSGDIPPALETSSPVVLNGVILGGDGTHCGTEGSRGEFTASYTLSNDDSCGLTAGTHSQENVADLGLGPLWSTQVDGVTQYYYPLLDGSPALDGGPASCDTDLIEDTDPDQLGNPRPVNGLCDIGAIEGFILYPTTLCADQWNGAVRMVDNCNRSETRIALPEDAPITLCVNSWNGSARVATSCSRSEQTVTAIGDHSVSICVNPWNGTLRVSDQCSRSERARLL